MAGSQDLSADQLPLLRRLAREQLPAEVAERWLRLARRAVQLLSPDDAGDAPEDFGDHRARQAHPVTTRAFTEALADLRAPGLGPDDTHHQLGGWAQHVQAAVETEVADDPLRWRSVLQVGSEPRAGFRSDADHAPYADDVLDFDPRGPWPGMPETPAAVDPEPDDEMAWDDLGALYWLARDDDLPGLTEVRFTHQSG